MNLRTRQLKAGLVGLATIGACIATATGAAAAQSPASSTTVSTKPAASMEMARVCRVRPDRKLLCSNKPGAPIYAAPRLNSKVVDRLRSNPSIFNCWRRGAPHNGGNNIWYWTNGDDHGRWGNVPAIHLHTQVDPPRGMRRC
jgi:hypothetical protein